MKVLITGGAGFIGSTVADLLISRGLTVAVVDNLSTGNRQNVPKTAAFYEVDICDKAELMPIFQREKPDIVFHLAAQINVFQSIVDPTRDALINIMGTANVLECSVKTTVKKVIYSSSAAVYGDVLELPIAENMPKNPQSFYGLSKSVPEDYLAMYAEFSGLDYTVLRYANVYGIRQDPMGEGGVISIFLSKIMQGKPIIIHGDGEQTRDFIYVQDIALANLAAIHHASRQIINISSNTSTSIKQLATMMTTIAGQPMLSIQFSEPRQGDIMHSRLDNAAAIVSMQWKPKYSLENGLKETINYYMTQQSL